MNNLVSTRVFNDAGLNEFEKTISELRNGNIKDIPESLLFSDEYSQPFEPVINIEKVNYKNKNELIPYLVQSLELKSKKYLYFDRGLWSWFAAFFFDNVCPVDGNGRRKINESAYYILREPRDYQKYYRHLLAYYCRLYSEVGDASKIFLVGSFEKRGDITEQLGSRQEIALNKGILDAANIMYWDKGKSNFKRGAAGKGAGSVRRLARIIGQYQLTYDLNSMNGDEIVNLLPMEFSKWVD